MSNTLLNSTLPSLPSSPTCPPPPPPLLLPLSATGPREFPRARGSPLSVSSDTVIRSVGTESVPLSEPHAPSFHWPSPFTPLTPSPPTIPLHFLCHLSFSALHLISALQEVASNLRRRLNRVYKYIKTGADSYHFIFLIKLTPSIIDRWEWLLK